MTDKLPHLTSAEREILHQAGYGTHREIMEMQESAPVEPPETASRFDGWLVFNVTCALVAIWGAVQVTVTYNNTGTPDAWAAAVVLGVCIFGIGMSFWRLYSAVEDLVEEINEDDDAS